MLTRIALTVAAFLVALLHIGADAAPITVQKATSVESNKKSAVQSLPRTAPVTYLGSKAYRPGYDPRPVLPAEKNQIKPKLPVFAPYKEKCEKCGSTDIEVTPDPRNHPDQEVPVDLYGGKHSTMLLHFHKDYHRCKNCGNRWESQCK